MIIKVTEVDASVEPRLRVYQVEIVDDAETSSWMESFATIELLLAFLRGIKVAFAMRDDMPILLPDGHCKVVRFAPGSCIDRLP